MSDAPKPIRIESTGKLTMRTNPDGSVSPDTRGPVHLHIESIRSIGVENLVDVEVHAINTLFNSVSHYIRFHGGGEIRFSFNTEGKLLEFEAQNVDARIVDGERIVLIRRM